MNMIEKKLEELIGLLHEKKIMHIVCADLGDGTASVGCDDEYLFSFLMSLVEHVPRFREVIMDVADELSGNVDRQMLN